MVIVEESVKLPGHFKIERELREQLSGRAGHQRCIEGNGELLLILHEVPKAGVPEREALYFWKDYEGRWMQKDGPGVSGVGDLLERYARAIDIHEANIDEADTAAEIFGILKHSGPLARSTRNIVIALEQVLLGEPDDREIRSYRDRAREIERAADLLNSDARLTLEFWRAERAEEQADSAERLGKIAYRLNLLAGFFLPLVAFAGLFGMNVRLPQFIQPMFWGIFFGGLIVGGLLLWFVSREPKQSD
ncbi:hypothetical protein JIN85_08530 [Luteolibacter pohnpeiensis]|uniref:CorA-like Mg2+ transporter protein n=1 Tax=Luteolibacter pohnpeiensis TaxID=454153 RepID=A0A934VW53_9BACT|nr:CorA family divalent cation transporter [Luteolibacter pohnpeiensis]MBK1882458.1 hypothetical protein [Luteolibacter pohnpeiensis]